MCVAVPGEVIEIHKSTAKVRIRKVVLETESALIESVAVGDMVLVHAGFIIEKISNEESDQMIGDLAAYSNITALWDEDS